MLSVKKKRLISQKETAYQSKRNGLSVEAGLSERMGLSDKAVGFIAYHRGSGYKSGLSADVWSMPCWFIVFVSVLIREIVAYSVFLRATWICDKPASLQEEISRSLPDRLFLYLVNFNRKHVSS